MGRITSDQIAELLAKDRAGHITQENLQKFLLNPSGTGYTVFVDYGKTADEMIAAGHYDWHDDHINTENFPNSGTDVATVVLELILPNKMRSRNDVLHYLEANGMRTANPQEFLAFGATPRPETREFLVLCLDEVSSLRYPAGGGKGVLCLDWRPSQRGIRHQWFDRDAFENNCRFMAVRKSIGDTRL